VFWWEELPPRVSAILPSQASLPFLKVVVCKTCFWSGGVTILALFDTLNTYVECPACISLRNCTAVFPRLSFFSS